MEPETEPLQRAMLSLHGLNVGDAVGEVMSPRARVARQIIAREGLPPAPWLHTDDTEMAMAIVEVLARYQRLSPDALAARFVARFRAQPGRGYGSGARRLLERLMAGDSWREASPDAFGGGGSKGNGAAMRVAPLGAYFAGDLARVAAEAKASAEVTHSHPEGIAGAIAVALAAAVIWESRSAAADEIRARLWQTVLAQTPKGETWTGLQKAAAVPVEMSAEMAARILGSGYLVTAPDTVPYALWCAARHLDFEEALLSTLEGDGDCDTNCAIVGGLVILYEKGSGLPKAWLESVEPLDVAL